jgi:general stress protein 26
MNKKTFLYNYLNRRMLCVLATNGPEKMPEAAVMEFGQTKNLEIIFDTNKETRKYTNLKKNPNIALAFGWDDMSTVQYEGVARELSGIELKKYKKIMFTKNPEFQKWEKDPGVTYFIVVPKWIRYSNTGESWELRFP